MDLLLIVRGLAALSVVVWHAGGYLGNYPTWINVPGRTAVWLFFGISGYVIAHGFVHGRYSLRFGDLRDFYANRLLRIYPVFLVLSALAWISEFLLTGNSPLGLKDIPAQLLAVQFDQNYALNGVFWTLGVEIHFYLIAPLLVALLMLRSAKEQILIYFAMVALNIFLVKQCGWSADARNVVGNLPHFLVGMIACGVVSTFRPSNFWFGGALIGAGLTIGTTNWIYHASPGGYWSVGGVLVDLAIFLLVLAHANFEHRRIHKQKMYAALTFLGTLSYGLYAWHGYWMKYYPVLADQTLLLIAVSLFSAYVSYRLIEVPALKLKRKHSKN